MNAVRIAILAAAAIAAVAVAFFVRQAMTVEPVQTVQVQERPSVRILAARSDLGVGQHVDASDFYWQAWPEEAITRDYIVEGQGRDAGDFAGSVVRAPIGQGEPVTGRRLVQQGDAGFMSAVLTPGMRALAVPISPETGAGGFILPNNRVDVIVTYVRESEETGARNFIAEAVVENVRVLAIDQIYAEDEDGEGALLGETATLELTPDQSRAVMLAVARGNIALVLRSLSETQGGPTLAGGAGYGQAMPTTPPEDEERSVTLIRYGRAQTVALAADQ
ncbi:MAG: Flp pilus assembly protein CpaB [Alphaproteobacteria bacterium]|nr:Flp pilus assembly protein CpaB [Alphaproteobacteria bacterium]